MASTPDLNFRKARPTLSPVELNPGESVRFELKNGRVVELKLIETHAAPLFSNVLEKALPPAGAEERFKGKTAYHFTALVEIDGQRMTLQRYVGVQESFYEPYVVNGLRIFFDAVADIFGFMTEDHGPCRPGAAARFALQDAGSPICPEFVHMWYPNDPCFIDMRHSYAGEDCWMGAYAGTDAHGGLDVDMPEGTPLFAPISVDDQHLADSVKLGGGNNRWDGFRSWPDGSRWILRVAHVASLAVKEHTPLRGGTYLGKGAGMSVGYFDHSHFSFRIEEEGGVFRLDPWIIFWQAFENARQKRGDLAARMIPPGPAITGKRARFCSSPSRAKGKTAFYWTFGDGGFSPERNPVHVFSRPGIYPVTLTVEEGGKRSSATCHLTVDGPLRRKASVIVNAPEDCSFRPRPAFVADTYGRPPALLPHTLRFTAMSDGAIEVNPYVWAKERKPGPNPWVPRPRLIRFRDAGGGRPPAVKSFKIIYEKGRGWLDVRKTGRSAIRLSVNPRGLPGDLYRALVRVFSPGADNSPQSFRVELHATARSPFWNAYVDDGDPECCATPFFWVDLGLPAWWPKPGHGGRFLANGMRARAGEFVRYTPFLWGGLYEVFLGKGAPFDSQSRFAVRVRHARGIKKVWVRPAKSLKLGRFIFRHGTEGFVEIRADGAQGQVVADAVFFRRLGDTPKRTWDHGMPRRRKAR